VVGEDDRGHAAVEAAQHVDDGGRWQRLGQRGEADDVGEQDARLLLPRRPERLVGLCQIQRRVPPACRSQSGAKPTMANRIKNP
jgi:hypothetical protein